MKHLIAALAAALGLTGAAAANDLELEYDGFAELELRQFSKSDTPQGLERLHWSASGELTGDAYYGDITHARVTLFGRIDGRDDRRSHWDARAAFVEFLWDEMDLKIGLDKEFWGVLESAHLVDLINQTDLIESIDGEDKLGQPMVRYSLNQDWGTLRFYVLPYFRERTFAGPKGRPNAGLFIDEAAATYENGDEEKHIDYAIRYSHVIGDWDIGLAHFEGTARAPQLRPQFKPGVGVVLVPFYPELSQTSLDLQATKDKWLWKVEALTREQLDKRSHQAGAGFEYSFYGILDSDADLGVVVEYLWDSRDKPADNPFDNDLFSGLRLTLNDEQSTSVLAGTISDLDGDALSFAVEAERRIGDAGRITLEYRAVTTSNKTDPLTAFADDDFLEVRLARFF